MAITPKLEIKQSQSLLMTPQLRQAINLLQMSNLELSSVIEQELASNPLLEREDDFLNQDNEKEQTIDDYALLTTYQTELNNCPAKGADISSCYDSVAKKILTAFYVYPEESIKDYQQLKEILNKIYANQFCTNKYTYPSGNLCATESQPDKLKALHFYLVKTALHF